MKKNSEFTRCNKKEFKIYASKWACYSIVRITKSGEKYEIETLFSRAKQALSANEFIFFVLSWILNIFHIHLININGVFLIEVKKKK